MEIKNRSRRILGSLLSLLEEESMSERWCCCHAVTEAGARPVAKKKDATGSYLYARKNPSFRRDFADLSTFLALKATQNAPAIPKLPSACARCCKTTS
jgi:hypothetical protein